MSNTLGHSLFQRALCRPPIIENQSRAHPGFSGSVLSGVPTGSKADHAAHQKCKPILSNRFFGNHLSTAKAKSSKGNHGAGYMVPRAVLATDPSPELAGKFNLDTNSELQVSVQAPVSGSAINIDFRITNGHDDLVLHWGAICGGKKDWALPFQRPDGTKLYKNKALRTPFIMSGPDALLNIEIDDPEIQAIEFLILDEAQNRWFKNNGENFQVKLPGRVHQNPNVSVVENKKCSLPENLVQINSYLRWERKGRQSYTSDQEKEEYEAARMELLEEISRGTSIEELRAKLLKNPSDAKKDVAKNEVTVTSEIPDVLVQVQAYIRWERAGKPNYSPEKQLMEFEEARKELQHELAMGASISELRKKLMKGNIQTKISAQLKTKKYFTVERIQRKKRDIMQLLNKYSPESLEENISSMPMTPTAMEACSKIIEMQDGGPMLNKKLFKLGDKELLVLVTNPLGKTKVYLATDQRGPLILHWALSRTPGEWTVPPSSILPPNSDLLDMACETPFVEASLQDISYQAVEIEIDGGDYNGIPFVLRSDGNWIKNGGSDFYVEFSSETKKSIKDAGDGKGTAKALLDKIAELESEAQKSLMHRFNIAADLIEQSRASGKLGLSGILVWMRFMATRQLVWNKNYNVKPREISKAQDRLTNLLQNMYQNNPQNREIVRMIMSTVGRGGEGDVGQRIRDEILVIQRNNDCKGGMMEEWHQKLHNNTSPDDVVICQALIDYITSDFDINVYWDTLNKNGVTKERLLSYDRAIHSEPHFRSDQKEGLLRDLGNYLRTLKAVHSGADLESAIATCMGYRAEGEGFMVGVQINPIRGLPSGFPDLLRFILDHIEDKMVEPLLELLGLPDVHCWPHSLST